MSRALALLPAILLALFAFALGGFDGSAHFPQSAFAALLPLALALAAASGLRDPLRLGRSGWIWPALLVVACAASLALSEVPRAGRTALLLLPAFLLLPAAVARVWSTAEARRLGVAAWSAAVTAVSLWALIDAVVRGAGRAAQPLGHHNLLGAFLAITLPVALVATAERGSGRALGFAAALTGGAALVATRSLSALAAVAVVALLVSHRLGRFRQLVAGLALLTAGLALPRAEAIVRGGDRSARARLSYAEAAWAGAGERPWFGWGPGSSPWTLSAFIAPRPGVNPAGELVGEPHSTPLRIGYELGVAGVAASALLIGLFARARWRERRDAIDPRLHLAGCAGVASAFLAGLGGSWLSVPALPLAVALSAGAALAALPNPSTRRARWPFALVAAYAVAAGLLLAPALRAQRASELATRASSTVERERLLREAEERDPGFPLYRARRAWSGEGAVASRVKGAVDAALAAKGIGPLWLKAGVMALEANQPRIALPAFERAVALDPLSGPAPFLLYVASNGKRTDCAARAFLGEPKLAAATWFRGREPERRSALAYVRQWRGIDTGWKIEFLRQAVGAVPESGEEADLVQRIDATPALSASLHLFRRAAVTAELTRIRIDRAKAARIRLPAATSLESSARAAFPSRKCAPG